MSRVLTFDLGTTYFKVAVFDDTGNIIAFDRQPTPGVYSENGGHEIDARKCIETIQAMGRNVVSASGDPHLIEAISFSTQTNSFLLLDAEDGPLTPIIVWNDQRAADREIPTVPNHYAVTGVPSMSGEFMVAKLAWLREFESIQNAKRLCLISDYLTLWLTGEHVTEAGAAGLTGLLDIRSLNWHESALDAFGVPVDWLPRPIRAGAHIGTLKKGAADALGLSDNCAVVAGCLDQYAGAIGAGNVSPGAISETTGTVLATVQCCQGFDANDPTAPFVGPAFQADTFYRMAFGDVSANLLDRYLANHPNPPTLATLESIATEASDEALDLSSKLIAMNTAEMRSAVESWATEIDTRIALRAIFETVAAALYKHVRTLAASPTRIVCVGGAARNEVWRRIKADVLGIPTCACTCPEPTSLGAAILAYHGLTGEPVPKLAERMVHYTDAISPDDAMYNRYQRLRDAAMG